MKTKLLLSCSLILFALSSRAAENPMDLFRPPRVSEPKIPSRSVNLKDFGAVADGKALNTAAFAKAIASLTEKGGGRVVVPPGLWLTGPIGLKSKIELHLEEGALIQFTGDHSQFPTHDLSLKGEKM